MNPRPAEVIDLLVVGGGLAGCLVAESARTREPGANVVVVDAQSAQAGSTNPLALCHPVVGGSFRPAPFLAEAYAAARNRYQNSPHATAITLVRHIPPGTRGERMLKSLPEAKAALADVQLHLNPSRTALSVSPAFAVRLRDLVHAARDALVSDGVQWVTSTVRHVAGDGDSDSVHVTLDDQSSYNARRVVLAAGAELGALCASRVEVEGGETVHAAYSPAEDATAHTARGAFFVPHTGGVRLGATHVATRARPRSAHVIGQELAARLSGVGPVADATFSDAWVGWRAFFRADRLALCGALEGFPHVYALGALGGTGLLWAPFLAARLVEQMFGGREVPSEFSPARARTLVPAY